MVLFRESGVIDAPEGASDTSTASAGSPLDQRCSEYPGRFTLRCAGGTMPFATAAGCQPPDADNEFSPPQHLIVVGDGEY